MGDEKGREVCFKAALESHILKAVIPCPIMLMYWNSRIDLDPSKRLTRLRAKEITTDAVESTKAAKLIAKLREEESWK